MLRSVWLPWPHDSQAQAGFQVLVQTLGIYTEFGGKGAMVIDIDSCYSRPSDSDMAMGCRSGLNVSMAPGAKQATHISVFHTAFASSNLPLSIGHGLFCLSPVPILQNIFAHHNGACLFSA